MNLFDLYANKIKKKIIKNKSIFNLKNQNDIINTIGHPHSKSITDENVLKISFSGIVKIGLPRSERSGGGRFFLGCL